MVTATPLQIWELYLLGLATGACAAWLGMLVVKMWRG